MTDNVSDFFKNFSTLVRLVRCGRPEYICTPNCFFLKAYQTGKGPYPLSDTFEN